MESARARLAELQDPDPEAAALARNDVAAAQARLDSARARLEELSNPSGAVLERARSKVSVARAALDTAEARLAELEDPAGAAVVLAANRVSAAQAVLDTAEARQKELLDPGAADLAQAQSRVAGAQAAVAAADAKLEALTGPDESALAAARMGVAAAEREVALNGETYAAYGIRAAEAGVAQAQAQVDLVESQLEDLKIVAPFDGIVTRSLLSVGATASPQAPVYTVATTEVVVSFLVEETVIGGLEEGRTLQFTSPALPGRTLDVQVDGIAPTAGAGGHAFLVKNGARPVRRRSAAGGVGGRVSVSINTGRRAAGAQGSRAEFRGTVQRVCGPGRRGPPGTGGRQAWRTSGGGKSWTASVRETG